MRALVRLAFAAAVAIWAWRHFVHGRAPHARASVAFADGSDIVVDPRSDRFERLATVARSVLTR